MQTILKMILKIFNFLDHFLLRKDNVGLKVEVFEGSSLASLLLIQFLCFGTMLGMMVIENGVDGGESCLDDAFELLFGLLLALFESIFVLKRPITSETLP